MAIYMVMVLMYIIYIERKPTMTYLDRLEMIEFIVNEVDRDTQGDFEEDLLRDDLEEAGDWAVEMTATAYGWC